MARERVLWVDVIKIFSLIYIVLVHFMQSMQKSSFIEENSFWQYIVTICAWIMVQVFFFCSGYLHQKQCRVKVFSDWFQQIKKKFVNLMIPYFLFTLLTIVIKLFLEDEVNNAIEQSVWHILFIEPIPPYWFLYILFILFAITFPIKDSKSQKLWLVFAGVLYLVYILIPMPYVPTQVCHFELWFVLGMTVAYKDWLSIFPTWVRYISLLFVPLSVLVYLRFYVSTL